jgi:hypothetical protein
MAEPNSGREVPIADAVTPNIISDIPKAPRIITRLSTKRSAALITIINDITRIAIKNMISNIISPERGFLFPHI